jgi:hypothetical protein
MNIFKNKFFLLGNLAFLLLVIPVVLYFVKNQTSTRGSAAPTTTLSFISPSLAIDQCDSTQTTRLVLNPGQNIVHTIQLALKWDKTKFDIDFSPNKAVFTQTLKGPTQTTDGMTITLSTDVDVTKAISTTTDVGTITVKPLAPSDGVIKLEIDPTGTQIYSFATEDGATENVYNSSGSFPLSVSIAAKTCTATVSPTVTETVISPSVTTTVTAVPTTTITPTVTTAATSVPTATPTTAPANQSPVCLNLATTAASGSAPLSVTLTAGGQDNDGIVAKTSFNFGDGTQQDVTTGMGTASVAAQLAHTYNSGGSFNATAVFTDNSGAMSTTCTQQIVVSGAVATLAPTATPTSAPIVTDIPTATPTINNPGGIGATMGIIGGIIVAIAAGIFLLAL